MKNKRVADWFDEYSDDIFHYLIYKMGTADVEDLVQEVFFRAVKGLDSFEEKANPKTWLLSIARHVAIDEIRKKGKRKVKEFFLFDKKEYEASVDMKTPEEIISQMETTKELFDAIQALKPNYRDVIIFRAIKELSVAETAKILNWTENKVRITFHRAIKTLQKERGAL